MAREEDQSPIERAIRKRATDAMANILFVKDEIHYLTTEDAAWLRNAVLREINELTNLCVELVQTVEGGGVANELYVDMVREIHSAVVKH